MPTCSRLALIDQGQYLMRLGRVDGGLRFLDEAMVAVTTGELCRS